MSEVVVRNLTLEYGATRALDDVSLDFPEGQLFGLLGPSGSGKTTLLRCIAGFVFPDSGTVHIDGQSVERVPVEQREIGMMFQSYALFPNMTVADNIGFGLRVRKIASGERRRRVDEALELVRLTGLGGRKPHQLSGGQRQRVALARAIVTRPRVLLLDEPLSALDKALRVEMQVELKRIQREVGITTIFVTHDQEEAMTLSDQIGILRDGRLVQSGPPRALYHVPRNRFAAAFLGEANFLRGNPEKTGLRLADGSLLPWPRDGRIEKPLIAVRPEEMTVLGADPKPASGMCSLRGKLTDIVFSGPTAICHVATPNGPLRILIKNSELANLPPMGPVWVCWPVERSMPLNDDNHALQV
jgi:putative spermidine/putrescine transport system ATP-binding protein